ncbi:DNA-3-methyladenine glycosylase family protein [Candidatus Nitrosoglobus terrae]|nr:DNA-3-methyladenine glycosylase [Candidatus Nitrosoglobus terrae]
MNKIEGLTSAILLEADGFLSHSCPVMASLIRQYAPCTLINGAFFPFKTLVNAIISQQLATKVADRIKCQVQIIVSDFTPADFLATSPELLRSAGLSAAKIRYITVLAQHVNDGKLDLETLQYLSDKEIITILVALPGIGQWTAEMFLIFGLHRPDVLPIGDVGLQRAIRLLFGDDARIEDVGQRWRPFCSVASWYLWRSLS